MLSLRHRTLILVVLATIAAAALFFGPDDWFGLNVGATGATVLYAVLVLLMVHMARHPDAVFPTDASHAERQGWVGLVFVALLAVHFFDFLAVLPALGARADTLFIPAARPFTYNLGLLIVAWAVAAGILRSQNSSSVALDERDVRIQHSAQRLASGVMSALIVAIVIVLALFPEALRSWLRPLIVANTLIGLLLARTFAEHILLVARYRRARA